MVRRKEWLWKGEKSIIWRRELQSEPCWCELYKSEKWRAIQRDVKIGNTVFEQRTWFSSPLMHNRATIFTVGQEKKKNRQVIWTSSSPELHLEGSCVSSLFPCIGWPSCFPSLFQLGSPELQWLTWKQQRKFQASYGPMGLQWQQTKLLLVCVPWRTLSTSACRATTPLISA